MNRRDQLVEHLVTKGVEQESTGLLIQFLQVPPVPEALVTVLRRMRHAADALRESSVAYEDQIGLDALIDTAGVVLDLLQAAGPDDVPPEVYHPHASQRPLYTRYPLYGALQRRHAHDVYSAEYHWLLGLLMLLRPTVEHDSATFAQWCMAVRAFGEVPQDDELVGPPELLLHLVPVVAGEREPGQALAAMRDAARGSRRLKHGQLLDRAWRHLVHRDGLRTRRTAGGGAGGYQRIRGVPSGPYQASPPTFPYKFDRRDGAKEWGAAGRAWADQDGNTKGGEAPGEAGTLGDTRLPPATKNAVEHYHRGAMWRQERRRQARAAQRGQDTVLAASPFTPQQAALVMHALLDMQGASDCPSDERYGSALCVIAMTTGIEREQLRGIRVVTSYEDEAVGPDELLIAEDGSMLWSPPAIARRPSSPPNDVQPARRSTVAWIRVPLPGVVRHVLPTVGAHARSTSTVASSITRALRAVGTKLDMRVTWDQLRRYWWGQLAAATEQPALATALTGYVRPATAVPQHYLHVSADRQHAAYARGYERCVTSLRREFFHLGYAWRDAWSACEGPVPSERPGHGSSIVPWDESLGEELARVVSRSGASLEQPLADAERCTTILYHVLTLWAGLRGVRTRAALAALFLRGFRAVSDKDTAQFSKTRELVLTPRLADRLWDLWQRRARALHRAGLIHGRLDAPLRPPRHREDLLHGLRVSPNAGLSYLGGSTGAHLTLLAPSEMRERGLDVKRLPASWPRHWVRTHLLLREVPDQCANAWMGHACLGQDPWGATSFAIPRESTKQAATALEPQILRLLNRLEKELGPDDY